MDRVYLPGDIRSRLLDLLEEYKITQADLALRIGISESSVSRFLSGKTNKISPEHLIQMAKIFNVSTDFLLGLTDTPEMKNCEISDLGLSLESVRNLYLGNLDRDVVNRLLENPEFAELTHIIKQYLDESLSKGFAAQNQLYSSICGFMRTEKYEESLIDINRLKIPYCQYELTNIQNRFTLLLKDMKQETSKNFEHVRKTTKGITENMYAKLTENREDKFRITPRQIAMAITDSVAGMEGVNNSDLKAFGDSIQSFMESTIHNYSEANNAV